MLGTMLGSSDLWNCQLHFIQENPVSPILSSPTWTLAILPLEVVSLHCCREIHQNGRKYVTVGNILKNVGHPGFKG